MPDTHQEIVFENDLCEHLAAHGWLYSPDDAGYLKEVRPRTSRREVFLTVKAPYQALSSGSLYDLVSDRLRALGVSLPHYGPHSLRHACATRLLAEGLSMKAVGDHLGHRKADTTRVYAKVDMAGLRQVADFDLGGLL